ncbi:hypothetical protein L6164_022475 [Bauhinia variegata]|uniref:Uncharacterized protein n=1 Tax=Bauhinia variegata TaxID=167791 RepID=A0ACB9MI70_BAUVA|nr:hypothetical protein L6164_022475 [Bauhinia variegata]
MARLTLLIALLGALLLITTTSGCKTTVRIDEGGSSGRWKESCQRQLQRVNLRHCEQHIMQRISQQQGEREQNVLRFRGGIYTEEEESRELSEKCCEQLEELKGQECQCQALQQIMQRQSGQVRGRQQEQRLEQELRNLPNTCDMEPMHSCELRGRGKGY